MNGKFPNMPAVDNTAFDNNTEQLAILSRATLRVVCELCD